MPGDGELGKHMAAPALGALTEMAVSAGVAVPHDNVIMINNLGSEPGAASRARAR